MVILHEAVCALRGKPAAREVDLESIVKLLSRLLSCVLGQVSFKHLNVFFQQCLYIPLSHTPLGDK